MMRECLTILTACAKNLKEIVSKLQQNIRQWCHVNPTVRMMLMSGLRTKMLIGYCHGY